MVDIHAIVFGIGLCKSRGYYLKTESYYLAFHFSVIFPLYTYPLYKRRPSGHLLVLPIHTIHL